MQLEDNQFLNQRKYATKLVKRVNVSLTRSANSVSTVALCKLFLSANRVMVSRQYAIQEALSASLLCTASMVTVHSL